MSIQRTTLLFFKETYHVQNSRHRYSRSPVERRFLDILKSNGSDETEIAKGMGAGITPEEMKKRLEMMDKAGVKQQVLSATPQSPYLGTEEQALKSARLINDTFSVVLEQFPDRFLAYGAVPLPHVDAAIEDGYTLHQGTGFSRHRREHLHQRRVSV